MSTMLLVCGLVVALGAAARSTWSPCGLSMLSSLTPMGERARGHRWALTAAWYIAGGAVGGATLGALSAGVTAAVRAAGGWPGAEGPILVVASALSLSAAAADAGVLPVVRLPLVRRQVDDGWLARYRPWFYAAGFGWQIGFGLVTYLMTMAVPLVVALGVLTGDPRSAFVVCGSFGLVRGASVLLTIRATEPARLHSLHRRIDRGGPRVRWTVVGVQAGVAAVTLGWEWPAAGLAVAGAVFGVGVIRLARARLALSHSLRLAQD